MGKCRKSTKLYIALVAMVILLNVIAWLSAPFCDWYIENIFPIWLNTYGRVTGWIPFSIGEYMLLAAAILIGAAILGLVLLLVKALRRFLKGFYKFFAWTFIIVCMVMTLNCTILYHASFFSET